MEAQTPGADGPARARAVRARLRCRGCRPATAGRRRARARRAGQAVRTRRGRYRRRPPPKAQHLGGELTVAQAELETTVAQLQAETERARDAERTAGRRWRAAPRIHGRPTQRLAADLNAAAQENADLNRRLQEIEARRAARDRRRRRPGRPRRHPARHPGAARGPDREADRGRGTRPEDWRSSSTRRGERLDEVESELRQQQMAQAMRADPGRRPPRRGADEPPRSR